MFEVPLKIKAFLWSTAYRSINTIERQAAKQLPFPPGFCLCLESEETQVHISPMLQGAGRLFSKSLVFLCVYLKGWMSG